MNFQFVAIYKQYLLLLEGVCLIHFISQNKHGLFSDKLSSEHATEMEDVKSLVQRLFTALHLEDHQIKRERELLLKLDHLKEQLIPFEQVGRDFFPL